MSSLPFSQAPHGLAIGLAVLLVAAGDGPPPGPPPTGLESASLKARRKFIESLTPDEQAELKQKQARFARLEAAERERIRQLHQQINAAPDRDQLRAALQRYNQWLKTLTSARRAELLSKPPDERLAEMKSIMEAQAARRMLASTPLQFSDYGVIKRWLYSYVRRNEEELVAQLPPEFKRRWEAAPQNRRNQMLAAATIRDRERMAQLKQADMAVVMRQLSPGAQKALENAGSGSRELMLQWLRYAGLYQRMSAEVSNEQLREFFNEMDNRTRMRLETLPPAELRAALVRMYHLSKNPNSPAISAAGARIKSLKGTPLRTPANAIRPSTSNGRGRGGTTTGRPTPSLAPAITPSAGPALTPRRAPALRRPNTDLKSSDRKPSDRKPSDRK